MIEELHLDSILQFGKHQGRTVSELIDDDPGYLTWLADRGVDFDEQAYALLEAHKIV